MARVWRALSAVVAAAVLAAGRTGTADETRSALAGRLRFRGAPLAGATVVLVPDHSIATDLWPGGAGDRRRQQQSELLTGRSGAGGSFRFDGLAPRRWLIYVQHPGVVPFVDEADLSRPALRQVDLELAAAAIVAGKVTDAAGRPAAAVTVRVSRESGARAYEFPNPRVRTGRDGRFELAQVPPGDYWLEAYARDGRMATARLRVDGIDRRVHDLALAAADDPGTLRLRVVDNGGRPVAGASVSASGPERLTDAAGWWRSRRYPPGESLQLDVHWKNQQFRAPAAVTLPHRDAVVITVPGGAIAVRFPGPAAGATVIPTASGTAKGTSVVLRDPDGEPPPVSFDAGGGVLRFELLVKGRWSLWAHHADHRMGHVEIQLGPGESKIVDAPLTLAGRTVRGRFVDRDGRPLPRVQVETSCWPLPPIVRPDGTLSFYGSSLALQAQRTDPDGRFELRGLHPGRRVVHFTGSRGASRLLFLVVPDGDAAAAIDVGDVQAAKADSSSVVSGLLTPTAEGLAVWAPPERSRLHAAGLRRGELVTEVDGYAMDGGTDGFEALALLQGRGPHEAVVRAAYEEKRVTCPPGTAELRLPFGARRDLAGAGTDPPAVIADLPAGHPWRSCLQPGDVLRTVSTDPKLTHVVNANSADVIDKALQSGRPVRVDIQRRGPTRRIRIPGE